MRHVLRTDKFPKHLPNNDCHPEQPRTSPTIGTSSARQARRTRPLSQTRKMYFRSTRSRISRSYYLTWENTNGPSQGGRSGRMDTPEEPHRTSRIHGLYQLLPTLRQGILKHSKTPQRADEEGRTLGMDSHKTTGVRDAEKAHMQRTSTPHANTREPI